MPRPALRFWNRPDVLSLSPNSILARINEKRLSGMRNHRFRKRVLPLLLGVGVLTLLTFSLSQVPRKDFSGNVLGSGFEVIPDPTAPVDESIILVVPPISSSVTKRPYVSPYGLDTLADLITSLAEANYKTNVKLRLLLAPTSDRSEFEKRYLVATKTAKARWKHGEVRTVNASSGGLFELMVASWTPHKGDTQRAVIVDAAYARSFDPSWFEYLQAARTRYAGIADVAAFSPVRVSVRVRNSVTGIVTHWNPPPLADSNDDVFMYQNTAYTPVLAPVNAEVWRSFQRWFASLRSEWFLWPNVVHPKDHKDGEWNWFAARGRAHWSLWFARFLAESDMYVLHPRRDGPTQDHTSNRKIPSLVAPIGPIIRVSYEGSVVQKKPDEGGATEEELNEIVRMGRRAGGSVAITIVTEAFLETAYSWICNVEVGGFKPKAMVWIAPDEKAYQALKNVNGSHAIHMRSFKGGRAETGTHFNSPGYWLLMLERTRLIRDLLDRGIGVFAFETDQIWLRDPVPVVRKLMESGDSVDLVGTLDTRNQIAGNFLYFAPTLAMRRLWREVTRRFTDAYRRGGMERFHTVKFTRYIENDQSIMTRLVFYDPMFKGLNGIVFRALDTDRFVDGRWYNGIGSKTGYYPKSASSPSMINNNFLVGIEPKKERAQKFGHWFLDEQGKCVPNSVQRAIKENEARAPAAEQAINSRTGSLARPEEDYDVGIDRAIIGISKALKAH